MTTLGEDPQADPRRTFIVRVHAPARTAVVQDARTGKSTRVAGLGGVGAVIEHWLTRHEQAREHREEQG
jgi:hypothetical protein